MLSINSNSLASLLANQLNNTSKDLSTTAHRIATGKRVLQASDDPAGMGMLSSFKSDLASYNAVDKNLKAGMSMLDVASSSLGNQQSILTQMKDLATQAANGTLSTDQRSSIQETFEQLQTQLDDTVNNASLFGKNLTGASGAAVQIQTGIASGSTYTLNAVKSDAATLNVDASKIDLSDAAKASSAMDAIKTAIDTVSTNQSLIGAQQNGLQTITKNVSTVKQNISDSISRVEDIDVAAETSKLQQLQSKMQLSTAMLGIVNQFPSYVLQLLR